MWSSFFFANSSPASIVPRARGAGSCRSQKLIILRPDGQEADPIMLFTLFGIDALPDGAGEICTLSLEE